MNTRNISNQIVIATKDSILKAARLIRYGRLVAFPTETVYGLGSDARNDKAVSAIFAAKSRPCFNPLIVHVASLDAVTALVDLEERGRVLASHLWPGPLTLVAHQRSDCPVSRLATAGLETLAVRVPDHPVALSLLTTVGCPVVAPSANLSGLVSPTTAAHVAESLAGAIDMILDGGTCRVGLESTVIDLSRPHATLLRPGGIATEDIEYLIGTLVISNETECAPRSPGMLTRHYAPSRPLRLNAHDIRPGEVLLGFGQVPGATLNLSQTANLEEAAANLFLMLRALDRSDVTAIAISPVPLLGLGRAINDRLRRAASR
ncbi:TsaC protein (YrdC domain) required for threonylcarbamoyladenosine t(6)A37 modification in tRNA [invertebrate metagenome]|uniref:Threonylcarbamoyl-AMP synthase n=1 Tax=invertebrate metagenome TaxID=1711999 RepID=A0A484H9R8_9ZZZZ